TYVDQFYKDKNALFQIFFVESSDSELTHQAVASIESIIGDKGYLAGSAASSKSTLDRINSEVPLYSVVAVLLILLILIPLTSSYLEPFIFLFAIGTAIIINLGTNIIQGEVSQITFSAASILQLAVSMDYSIFILHRFHEERGKGIEVKQAMLNSLKFSLRPVLASGITTMAGFAALTFMNYGIGKDMGFVLGKGIIFSLITVLTLLPALIILLDKWIEKYTHKELKLSFKRLANKVTKLRYFGVTIAILVSVIFFLAQGNVNYYYSYEGVIPADDRSNIALREIEKIYGETNSTVIIIPKIDKVKEVKLIEDLKNVQNVKSITGLYNEIGTELPELMIPDDALNLYQSDSYSMFTIFLSCEEETEEAFATVDEIRNVLSSNYDEWFAAGGTFSYKDLADVTNDDFERTTILSIIFIFIILVVTFKSLSVPLIAIFVIELAIWVNLGYAYFFDEPMSFLSFIIVGAIQLGATVDYAILYISRYKENLERMNTFEAARKTIQDTAKSIITSGGILVAGTFSVYFIATIETSSEMCLLIGRGAIISMVSVIVLLPSFLMVFEPIIKRTTLNWPTNQAKEKKARGVTNEA
ncbi:MAG: RND family transporter, partial [Vulcanibacillus sp.]